MTGKRDTARPGRVLVLPVTTFHGDQMPAIVFYQFDDITDLHLVRHQARVADVLRIQARFVRPRLEWGITRNQSE